MNATVYAGLAVVSKDPGRTAFASFTDVSFVEATSSEPPPPPPAPPAQSTWAQQDVGGPALAGRASESNGIFAVTGAGSDIWNSSDQFSFMYQFVAGDHDIVARLVDIENVNAWSKAGVMIRESLSASAAHVLMAGTPAKGWAFQRRPVSGGTSVHSPGSFGTAPGWVRLSRTGDTFSAYESTDGVNWTLVGTETIAMPQSVFVGLAVTSHNATRTASATFSDVAVTLAATDPELEPPTVSLTAPAHDSTFTAPASIGLAATATDADGTVSKVEFFANGALVGADDTSPYEATWTSVPAGTYDLTAVATDDRGATTTSPVARVIVTAAPNEPPSSAVTSPANGATFTAPATITITAMAADADGAVTRVDFYAGTVAIGAATASPYSITWPNVPAGTYQLTAVARDDAGALTTSAAVTVTVNAGTTPPSPTLVAFNPSPDHDTAVTSYSVAVYREGDPDTAAPAATKDLGKPTPSNDDISADVSDIVDPLAPGSYYVVVTALGPGGSASSAPSAAFTK